MFEIEELEAGQPLPGGANLLGTNQESQTRDEVGRSRVSGVDDALSTSSEEKAFGVKVFHPGGVLF